MADIKNNMGERFAYTFKRALLLHVFFSLKQCKCARKNCLTAKWGWLGCECKTIHFLWKNAILNYSR